MTDMQQYVVEEWAEDYRAGRLGRREFLRRMTIMAGGAALAIPLLSRPGLAGPPAGVKGAAPGDTPRCWSSTRIAVCSSTAKISHGGSRKPVLSGWQWTWPHMKAVRSDF